MSPDYPDFPDISKIYPDFSRNFPDFNDFWVLTASKSLIDQRNQEPII